MAFGIVYLLLVLLLWVGFNRGLFEQLGLSGVVRLGLVWAVVFAGLALAGRLLGLV